MKKLYLVITLFVSSFFLFNSDVKAARQAIISDFDFVDNGFLEIKSSSINYVYNSDYKYYFIIYYPSTKSYVVYFSKETSTYSFAASIQMSYTIKNDIVSTSDFVNFSAISSFSGYLTGDFGSYSSYLVYSNYEKTFGSFDIEYIYSDYSYFIGMGNKFIYLYDFYLDYQNYLGNYVDPHQEEIDKLESFYILCIDKLNYLSEVFLSNYIYLSIIVIFIIIFVFKLIFRRFL